MWPLKRKKQEMTAPLNAPADKAKPLYALQADLLINNKDARSCGVLRDYFMYPISTAGSPCFLFQLGGTIQLPWALLQSMIDEYFE